jgi:predicted dehydrogenase
MVINRILIVGLGSIGRRHLRLGRKIFPQAQIKVLRHQATDDVPKYSNGCFSTIADAIDFAPQIAVISSPAPFHIGVAQSLADRGVNLLVEKPLATSMEGVVRLIATSKRRKIVLVTGYNLRFLPSLQKFRSLLKSGIIGNVFSVRCESGQFLPSWRPDSDYRHGVSANKDLGGGVLLELSHELDYLRWIFGEINWVRATLTRQSDLDINVEDSAHLTLGFEVTDQIQQLVASVNLDFIRHDSTRLCTVIGKSGSLRWNGLSGDVELFKQGSSGWNNVFSHEHNRDDSYIAEWGNFINSVYGDEIPLVTGEDGFKTLQIIEAAQRSSESGVQVIIENN